MSSIAFRNKRGDIVDPVAVPASDLKDRIAKVLEDTLYNGAVVITKNNKQKAVLISIGEFEALLASLPDSISSLTRQFDGLVATLQTPKARSAVAGMFESTPQEFGRAAVAATKAAAAKVQKRR